MTAITASGQILELLLQHADLMSSEGPMLPVAQIGALFTPPQDQKFLELTYLPNKPKVEPLGSGMFIEQVFLQVTVHWPQGQGAIALADAIGAVKTHFAKGTELIGSMAKVIVSSEPWEHPDLNGLDMQIPVSIPYQAFRAA